VSQDGQQRRQKAHAHDFRFQKIAWVVLALLTQTHRHIVSRVCECICDELNLDASPSPASAFFL
jgi:hypothetical protein